MTRQSRRAQRAFLRGPSRRGKRSALRSVLPAIEALEQRRLLEASSFDLDNAVEVGVRVGIAELTPTGSQLVQSVSTKAVNSFPLEIISGPQGYLWYIEANAGKLGRINPSNFSIAEFSLPDLSLATTGITAGPDGAVWFAETNRGKIGRFNPGTFGISEFDVPTVGAAPWGIATGADGKLWFAESGAGKIGRLDPLTGAVTEFVIPTAGVTPRDVTLGPDGAIWFTESAAGRQGVGRITTSGAITEFTTTTRSGAVITDLISANGALWITEAGANVIARVSTTGVVTEFAIPTPGAFPRGITVDVIGNLYFTEADAAKLGRLTPSGAFSEFDVSGFGGSPTCIAYGPDGHLWYTDTDSGAIWQIELPPSKQNSNQVKQAYLDLLNRSVDASGLYYWTTKLDEGGDRGEIARQLTHSAEYYGAIIVAPAYARFLGRLPDAQGIGYWVDQMQNHGLTDERLEAGFIGSPEYYQHSGGTDVLWVDAMYLDLLGRLADRDGETYWTGQLQRGVSRADVAYGFAASLERETERVQGDYLHFLRRAADAAGVAYWVDQFAHGVTNEDLIAGFIASNEYYALSQQLQNIHPISVAVNSPANGMTATSNVTITGQVTGGGAGLALRATIDSGAPINVPLNGSGGFTLLTTFAIDGSADGAHTIHFQATDNAGDPSTAADFNFRLDSRPPLITITSPADGATVNTNVTLTGQVTDATSGVASLMGAVDFDPMAPVTFNASGVFNLTTALPLDGTVDGLHAFQFQAIDAAGNYSATTNTQFILDSSGPVVNFAGAVSGVAINHNLILSGQVIDALSNVQSLATAVDGAAFTSVAFDASGNFTLPATIFALNGSADGPHAIHFRATDSLGNLRTIDFNFTLDTIPPAPPVFDLAQGAKDVGPNTTSAARVTLVGQTDPGATVLLVGAGLSAQASGSGTFQIPGVQLTVGDNALQLQATDPAGNTSSATRTVTRSASPPAQPNPVIVWNQAALVAIQTDATDPLFASRGLAMTQAAVFDAVNAIEGTPAYYVKLAAPAGASVAAAVNTAAHDVLVYLYPNQRPTFDALLASQIALLPAAQSTTDGQTIGAAAAAAIIALRANDGSRDFVDYAPPSGPGFWQATAPAYAPALDPQWADLTPFALASPDQFRPTGPPPLTSQQWADAVNQVQALGKSNSASRTADQTQIAQFWNDGAGTYTPPGHWNAIAQTVAQQQGDSIVDDARLFAQLNVALADAGVTAWNAKYAYETWRPITVIHDPSGAGNPAVTADPNWYPFLTTPNFPEYVSGHSTFSAAAATVLDAFFGDSVSFSATEVTLAGVTRNFTSFDQAAAEAGMSRIYGGIHFDFSNADGAAAGKALAAFVLSTFDVKADTSPPRIALDTPNLPTNASPTVYASNHNFTIAGQVLDNLSGVARLEAQVDQGAYAPVSFNTSTGRFSFTTALALNGSADGMHVVHFRATDAAGNVAAPAAFQFALGTQPPVISLAAPSNGESLALGATTTGAITTSGPALVALGYRFDAGATMPISFSLNAGAATPYSYAFSGQVLDLSRLAAGPHTLTFSATDAAGNIANQTLNLTLAAAIPLMLTDVTPMMDAPDVSLTFRPAVTFTRPIDVASLTSADFYVSGPDGVKLAATIVPAADRMSALLFITDPMPGASRMTLTVDGSAIRTADGVLLDAANSGVAGSKLVSTFTTVSAVALPGTSITGIVADTGPDLIPMSRDDVRSGPDNVLGTADDIYLRAIQGVRVYVIGHENEAVMTDSQGRFSLSSVPAGDVKLVLQGPVAGVMTYDPALGQFVDPRANGYFFPEMVMDLDVRPGVANTVMGAMGTVDQQSANATNLGVYLPRLQTSILHAAGGATPTTIPLQPSAAQGLTPQQAAGYSITVAPNSLIGFDGMPIASAQVGFSTVSQALVRDMLPQGVTQLSSTLTIQAPGVALFSPPLQLTFANLYGAAPGSLLDVYSFDHTTGMFEVTGVATVSADGKTATTNPGSGITHPGWFGTTPPGGCGGSGGPPPAALPDDSSSLQLRDIFNPPTVEVLGVASGEPSTLTPVAIDLYWNALQRIADPSAPPTPPTSSGCDIPNRPSPGAVRQPDVTVKITVLGPLKKMLDQTGDLPLESVEFTLLAGSGETKNLSGRISAYATLLDGKGLKDLTDDQLFGSQIDVVKTTVNPDGSNTIDHKTYYFYRFVDTADAFHSDMQIDFQKALPGVTRTLTVNQGGALGVPAQLFAAGAGFTAAGNTVTFAPSTAQAGHQTGSLTIKTPEGVAADDTIELNGVAAEIQHWYIDPFFFRIKLRDNFNNIFDKTILGSQDENGVYQFDPNKADAVLQKIVDRANAILAPYRDGLSGGAFGGLTNDPGRFSNKIDFLLEDNYGIGDAFPDLGVTTEHGFRLVDNGSGVYYNGAYFTGDIIENRSLYSVPEQDFRLSMALNQEYSGAIELFLNSVIGLGQTGNEESFVSILGVTIAHEIGHALGMNHTNGFRSDDIMFQGYPKESTVFNVTDSAMRVALGMAYADSSIPQKAIDYYSDYASNGTKDTANPQGSDSTPFTPGIGVAAVRSVPDGASVSRTVEFGSVSLGAAGATVSLLLKNIGDKPLALSSLAVTGDAQFTVSGLTAQVLAPKTSLPFTVTFLPNHAGPASATLKLGNDGADPDFTIDLTAIGQSAAPSISLSALQNNLGGVKLGASTQNANVATVTNYGAQPLMINAIQVEAGGSSFTLVGVPANLAANPITLATGQTFTFGVKYAPSKVGLERATIDVSSNDPLHPLTRFGVAGAGLDNVVYPDWGNDYVAIEFPNQTSSLVLRDVSDDAGNFDFFLPSRQNYHVAIFDPVTGLIAHGYGTTPPSGQSIDLTNDLVFRASTAPDTDGDGLPDDVEFAIGSSPKKAFTSGDGIDDFTHVILNHTDPLGGHGLPIGAIAALPLSGNAEGITVVGSTTNAAEQTAYVATGAYGLAIVDATQFTSPALVSQIALPGDNRDVAVDPTSHTAAVAGGLLGLHLVDVSNSQTPRLKQTVSLTDGASAVTVLGGLAFVASGSSLVSVDLATGEVVQALPLGGGELTGLARDGARLVTMDVNKTLRLVDVNADSMTAGDSLTLSDGAGKLFAGGGIAYVPATSNGAGGFATVDISNLNQPQLLGARAGSAAEPGTAVTANGSGLAILIGLPQAGSPALDVFNIGDPAHTDQFLTRVALPGVPNAMALAQGIAFVADGSGGLQVVNYKSFDTAGVPPTLTISTALADANPAASGFQVVAGTLATIRAQVFDDVQVRNVELLVNGQVTQNAVSFPFDLSTVIPNPTGQSSTVTIQARATDTGGNVALSNVLTYIATPDNVPPTIVSASPAEGGSIRTTQRVASVTFSEALAGATVSEATFQILDANNAPVALSNVGLRNADHTVQLVFDELTPGAYRLVIEAAGVTDRAGNPLGAADVVRHFSVVSHLIHWTSATSGDWNNPANWDLNRVPGADDDVVIDVPGTVTVTVSANLNQSINSLFSKENIVISTPKRLTIAAASEIDGDFSLLNTAQGVNLTFLILQAPLTLAGASQWTGGGISGAGGVINTGTLTLSGMDAKFLEAPLRNLGLIVHTGGQEFGLTRGSLLVQSGVTLTNEPDGAYDFRDDFAGVGGDGSLVNKGVFRKSVGTGANEIGFENHINNGGSFDVQTGEIVLSSSNVTNASAFQVTGAGFLSLVGSDTSTYAGAFNGSGGGNVRLVPSAFSGGTMEIAAGGATFNFPAGMLELNDGILDASAGSLINAGVITLNGAQLAGVVVNNGTIVETDDCGAFGPLTIDNQPGGVYEIQGDGIQLATLTKFDNRGTFRYAGTNGGATSFLLATLFDNSGVIEIDGGKLQIRSGLTATAPTTFDVATGATLSLFPQGRTVTGSFAGTGAGAVSIDDSFSVGASGASLNFPTGMLTWQSGTIGGGVAGLTNDGSLTIVNGRLSGLFTNTGSVVQTSGGLSIDPGAVFLNQTTGIYDLQNSATVLATSGTTSTFRNLGVVRRSQPSFGTSEIRSPLIFDNQGTVEVAMGTLRIGAVISQVSAGALTGGTWKVLDQGNATLDLPSTNLSSNAGNVMLSGAAASFPAINGLATNSGSLTLLAGKTFTTSGSLSNSGVITAGAGSTLAVSGNYSQTAAAALNVQIAGAPASGQFGHVQVAGAATLNGGFGASLVGGFLPDLGDSYAPFTFGSRNGDFAVFTGLDLGNGNAFATSYQANGLTLTVQTAPPLLAVADTSPSADAPSVTRAALESLVQQALVHWAEAGLSQRQLDALGSIHYEIGDLGGLLLAFEAADEIVLDFNAAGYGWFSDPAPQGDAAFSSPNASGQALALPDSAAASRYDLLTVIMHEMGHVLGLVDLDPAIHPFDLMTEDLAQGVRRRPTTDDVDRIFHVF